MKLKKLMIAEIFFVLLLMAPAHGMLSADQVSSTAESYLKNGEGMGIRGPLYYQNHPYYYVNYTLEGEHTGAIVIDADTGNVVTNESIAEKILITGWYWRNITDSVVSNHQENHKSFEIAKIVTREELKLIEENISTFSAEDQAQLKDLASAAQKLISAYDNISIICKNSAETCQDVLNGNVSYENVAIAIEELESLEVALTELEKIDSEVLAGVEQYYKISLSKADIYGINTTDLKTENDMINRNLQGDKEYAAAFKAIIEEDKTVTEKNVERDKKLMSERVKMENDDENKATPGFGFLAVICTVLAAVFLIRTKTNE